MEPIINPLWFYLIDVLAFFGGAARFIGIALIIITVIGGIVILDRFSEIENWFKSKTFKKVMILSTIMLIIGMLIPAEETAYKMLIASLITPDNIAATGGAVQDIIDYIINSVDTLLESNG